MKLAFSKATADLDESNALRAGFRLAGYEGLQLKPNQYTEYVDDPARFLKDWGNNEGVASGMITLTDLSDSSVEALRKTFAFGSKVGTDLIVLVHYVPREGLTDDDIRAYARELSALGKEAQSAGVKLSLHHHYQNPVMHRKDFDTFFAEADTSVVGLTVDTAHLVKSGVYDIAGLIRDMKPVIDNFHLKDFADGEFKVLGQGNIDFAPIFAAISEIGYDGWVSADEESGSGLDPAMQECFDFMTKGFVK